jgi:hypothetical protein
MSFKKLFVKQTLFTSIVLAGLATSALAKSRYDQRFAEVYYNTGTFVHCDPSYAEGNNEKYKQCLAGMSNAENALITLQSAHRTEKLQYFGRIFLGDAKAPTVRWDVAGELELNISLSPEEMINAIQSLTTDYSVISQLEMSFRNRVGISISCFHDERPGLDSKSVEVLGHKVKMPVPVIYEFTFNSCVSAMQRMSKVLDQDPGFEAWLRDESRIEIIVLGMEERSSQKYGNQAWIDISHNVSDAALKKQLRDAAAEAR